MTVSIPEGFLPTAFSGQAWDQARQQLARPRDGAFSLETLRAETAIRDLLLSYIYALDLGDIDGIMAVFTHDCVMNGPTGTLSGIAAIRAHYERVISDPPARFHLLTNTVVRVAADLRSGQASSYFFALRQKDGESPHALGGLLTDQLVDQDGEWKVCARSIALDLGWGSVSAHGGH